MAQTQHSTGLLASHIAQPAPQRQSSPLGLQPKDCGDKYVTPPGGEGKGEGDKANATKSKANLQQILFQLTAAL